MTPSTGRRILIVMAPLGWVLACVLGVLACLLSADNRGQNVPWQILGALVLGSMVASIPVGFVLLAAYRALGGEFRFQSQSAVRQPVVDQSVDSPSWQWPTFAILCGLEMLVFPLSLIAAAAEDETLIVSIPFNLAIVSAALMVACWPHRQRASIVICTIHLLGIVLATFAAAVEVDSVVISAMLLFVSGLALASVGTRPVASRMLFGLSTVVFILLSSFIIWLGGVREQQAEVPLFAAMVAYQFLFVPVGLRSLYCTFSERDSVFRAQFGLKSVMGAMLVACLASGLAKLAYSESEELRVAVAVGLGALTIAGIAAAIAAAGWAKWKDEKLRLHTSGVA